MVPPRPPRTGPDRRAMIGWDVLLSGLALTATGMMIALGVFCAVFLVAFADFCPPSACSALHLLVSVAGPLVVAVAAGIAGLATTALRIAARRISWPFALATLVITTLAIGSGVAGYAGAIGY